MHFLSLTRMLLALAFLFYFDFVPLITFAEEY